MDRPYVTIVAGPNGSGKSTIIERVAPVFDLVNADDVARSLHAANPELASLAAGRLVVAELDRLIQARKPFSYETTLSSHQSLSVMRRAKAAGYEVGLLFVFVESVELCVKRVQDRVSAGGHNIPEAIIRRRYDRTFGNFPLALTLADQMLAFDNSGQTPKEVLRVADGRLVRSALDTSLPSHARIDRILISMHSEPSTTTIPSDA